MKAEHSERGLGTHILMTLASCISPTPHGAISWMVFPMVPPSWHNLPLEAQSKGADHSSTCWSGNFQPLVCFQDLSSTICWSSLLPSTHPLSFGDLLCVLNWFVWLTPITPIPAKAASSSITAQFYNMLALPQTKM